MTDYAHPKCYAAPLGGCSTIISREHYLSQSVLKQIHEKPIVESGVHKGSPGGRYGIKSLTAKILCTTHNSALSPLDTEASMVFEALDAFETAAAQGSAPTTTTVSFEGPLFERWLLKTAFGLCKGGIATGQGSKITTIRDEAAMLRVLYGLDPFPDDWGLYLARPEGQFAAPANVAIEPRTNPATGEVMQLGLWLRAFEFLLCLGVPAPITPEQYRPGGLRLLEHGTTRSLDLTLAWPSDGVVHHQIEMTRVGQQQGWAEPRS